MAKLIAVCRDDEYRFERRQIPLMIEESLTMVMEIPETIISAEYVSEADVAHFFKRHSCLTQSEMNKALMVGQKDLIALLAVSVPCVGCRRSVERLYNQLWKSRQPAIEPLMITATGILTLTEGFLVDAKLIYALFYIHGSHLNDVVDTIPKSRRNRRCILHSLETHKTRASGSWIDVWDLLSQECRDEVVLIDADSLLDTLDNYLRKHRFCSECKSKVLKAYSILSGDIDGDSEKGYCAALYEGLKSCPKERHIHVVCDTDFIAHLIGRAEPELAGGRRERHARTIDIAQEEVLTCLGIHLWERLHRLWQKLRAEEQTWQMLFYLGVEALRKSFETAVEEKQGVSQLELVVEEISEAERAKEQRKENKRMKKKKRKENKAKLNEDKIHELQEEEKQLTQDDDELSENDEKICNGVDGSESLDGSEKSSCGSQISPRKTDEEDENLLEKKFSCSPCHVSNLTDCTNFSKSNTHNLTPCSPTKEKLGFIEVSKLHKCNPSEDNTSDKSNYFFSNCNHSTCTDRDQFENKLSTPCRCDNENKLSTACRCDNENLPAKRNGYTRTQNYKGNEHLLYSKRNGYSCKGSSPNIGPRFNRCDNTSRHTADSYNGNVYDKCFSFNNSVVNGRGRGKRKGLKDLCLSDHSNIYCKNHYINGNDYHTSIKNDGFSSLRSPDLFQDSTVDDEGELRLLKMMGWNSEDSTGISEKDIQDFAANRSEVQTRRQELRDHLRDQFHKLSVKSMRTIPVSINGVQHLI
ncbi:gametogenetin-binding protein 2 isoform X2 [Hydra vulgaris]|uniref:Gametogenetin-binding protein 2 isoform X2 n=1 Tax=Hydra vulgaris TaxID=6087 RepID=A0ABM4CPL4_HYDVU